jgi:two-component system, OmpR family, sensor histidine kinase CssS
MDSGIGWADEIPRIAKEFSLTQQLFGIVFLFIVFFVSFFFMFLSWNIDGFVRSQMYGIIRRTQSNIVYNYRLSVSTEALFGGNDPNIVHIIFNDDGTILASSNVDSLSSELVEELRQNAYNQQISSRDYISSLDDQKILYTVSRINMSTAIASTISSSYRDEFKTTLLNSVVNIMVIVVSVLFFLLMIWVAYLIPPAESDSGVY